MTLHLYDTYTRSLREFQSLHPPEVGLYSCGPTVYDYAHIGNLRTYLFVDLLRRTLLFNGYAVKHVMNITDVGHLVSDADTGEDKMEIGQRRTGQSAWEIAELYTRAFQDDLQRLHILEPTIWSKATDHLAEQIALIQSIEAQGFTYRTADGIYFDTSRQPDYGFLARLDVAGLQAGLRVEMGEKRHATDFALWKFSPRDRQRQMEWASPWGTGFPGWHIECSAMSAKYLGTFFDIHCGGEDHISVHHPNEIAQAQAGYGTRLANFWVHGYFLNMEEARMSKSTGGFVRLQTLIDRGYDPIVYRFFCFGAHYRARLNFTWRGLDSAATAWQRLRTQVRALGQPGQIDEDYAARFATAINDDLNLPRAVAVLWDLLKSDRPNATKKATLLLFDRVLGLGLTEERAAEELIPEEVLDWVQQRQQARAAKQWPLADLLRGQIGAAGYEIEDTPQGPRVQRAGVSVGVSVNE